MMKTKHISTILIFLAVIARGQQPLTGQIKEYDLTLQKLMVSEKPTGTTFKVKATLTNNTPDTLYYFSMTCSWQEFYHTDNKTLRINISPCDKNVQTVVAVPPKGSNAVELEVISQKNTTTNPMTFKIGLDLVKAKSKWERRNFDKLNRTSIIIWSDKLTWK